MKNPQAVQKISTLSTTMFAIFLGVFLFSIAVFLLFLKLNHSVKTVEGKVINTHTNSTVYSGRRKTYNKEYVIINYVIDGKEHTREITQRRKNSFAAIGDRVPVYYYPGLPRFAWFYDKSNFTLVYSIIFLLIATFFLVISWLDVRKEKKRIQFMKTKGRKG